MLQEEIVEILKDELVEFLNTYIAISAFTHDSLSLKVENQKSLKFIKYTGDYNWKGELIYHVRHSIVKAGRTKLQFSFKFHKDELNFALQLMHLLDGYIDYNMSNVSGKNYWLSFTIDVYSKENCISFFNDLNFSID